MRWRYLHAAGRGKFVALLEEPLPPDETTIDFQGYLEMKTFLTMLAAMFMTFGVIGCGGGGDDATDDANAESEATPPVDDATTAGHDGTEGGKETPAE